MRISNADIQIAKSCLAAKGSNADGVDSSCTLRRWNAPYCSYHKLFEMSRPMQVTTIELGLAKNVLKSMELPIREILCSGR
jgi:hypothetical protein